MRAPLDKRPAAVETTSPVAKRIASDGKVEARLFVRIIVGKRRFIGPGRADLLEQLDRTGSISAAARAMRMSYRRAWLHIEDLSQQMSRPMVETAQGGRHGGGAVLTAEGRALLDAYRRMQRRAGAAVERDLEALLRLTKRRAGRRG